MNHVLLRLFISESLNSHVRAIAINSIFFCLSNKIDWESSSIHHIFIRLTIERQRKRECLISRICKCQYIQLRVLHVSFKLVFFFYFFAMEMNFYYELYACSRMGFFFTFGEGVESHSKTISDCSTVNMYTKQFDNGKRNKSSKKIYIKPCLKL